MVLTGWRGVPGGAAAQEQSPRGRYAPTPIMICPVTCTRPMLLLYAATVCCYCMLLLYAATVCCYCGWPERAAQEQSPRGRYAPTPIMLRPLTCTYSSSIQ
eukprot:1891583-Rhodomonas_salina.1